MISLYVVKKVSLKEAQRKQIMSKSEKELKVESVTVREGEMAQLRHRLTKEMVDLTDEYVTLHAEESNLDGRFSAEELRTIADKMDELKAMESKLTQ